MMTYEMCLASRMSSYEIRTIVALTIAFCICGTISAFTSYLWAKIALGVKGTIYCIIVLYKLGRESFQDTPRDFMQNVGYYNFITTVIVWPLYILTWGLGPDVYSIISANDEEFVQQISSLILKTFAVAYAILTFDFDIEAIEEVVVEIANFAVQQ
jgi:bacteriorhodopsin